MREEAGASSSVWARFLRTADVLEVDASGRGEARPLVDRRVARGRRGGWLGVAW